MSKHSTVRLGKSGKHDAQRICASAWSMRCYSPAWSMQFNVSDTRPSNRLIQSMPIILQKICLEHIKLS